MNSSAKPRNVLLKPPGQPSLPFVMLLDDDSDIAEMYRLGLQAAGFRVSMFAEPSDFLVAVARAVPDIAVLDWRLPGKSGVDVLEELRQNPRTAQLPVFILSNFLGDQNGAIDRVFELGALAWLRKSLTSPDALAQRLKQAIGPTRYGRRETDRA